MQNFSCLFRSLREWFLKLIVISDELLPCDTQTTFHVQGVMRFL